MNFANQLIQKAQNRFGNCSSGGSLDNLSIEQLKARKGKINSMYLMLGIVTMIMLIVFSFANYDQLALLIPFTAGIVAYLFYIYKEYRKKIDAVNEQLNDDD